MEAGDEETRWQSDRTSGLWDVLACGLIFGAAGPAFAQRASLARDASPHGFYVSLTAFGDIERFSQDSSGVMNGQTEGLGIGIGTFVTPRWSLEFEASGRRFIDGEPLIETYGSSAGGINTIIQQRTQSRHRMDGGTVLLAFHPSRRGRFRLAYSAGLSFVRLQRELTFDAIYSETGATMAAHGVRAVLQGRCVRSRRHVYWRRRHLRLPAWRGAQDHGAMIRRPFLFTLAAVLAIAAPARAQQGVSASEPHGFYVSATIFDDVERFSKDSDKIFRLNGRVEGLGVGIGTFLSARWRIEFEAAVTRSIGNDVSVPGFPGGGGNAAHPNILPLRMVHRSYTGTALLAFHPSRRGRVQMAYAAGLAFTALRRELEEESIFSDQSGTHVSPFISADTSCILAPAIQIEASVRLTRRLSVVPYFRALSLRLSEQAHPGVAGDSSGRIDAVVVRPGAAFRILF